MNIVATLSGTRSQIGVLGQLVSPAERAELVGLLERASPDLPVQVDVYDADTLPLEVIQALAGCLDRGIPLKLVAYHGLLVHALMRLGLPVQAVIGPGQTAPWPECRAIALAGSARSLDKILHIVAHLPLAEVAVFVAQHIAENEINLLDQLLRVRSEYRVIMPQHLVAVEPGTIHVAPPGHHLKVAHGLVYLTRDRKIQFARPSIDVLFESLALEYRERVLAVLLCGFGTDGVAGCAALKQAGACVLVEDSADCMEATALTDAARQAGHFDHLLKLPAIASLTAAAAMGRAAKPEGESLELFLEALWSQYGFDYRGFQRDSLSRRIGPLVARFGLPDFTAFQRAILSSYPLFERMVAEMAVGVTGFFRHPEQFQALRREVLPYLDSFPVIKVWSAGCATGEEPYSLAMLLAEMGLMAKSRLFATDLNHHHLTLAKAGLFPLADLESSRSNYAKSGGPSSFDAHIDCCGHYFSVKPALRAATLFHLNNLVDEGVFNEFQLIVCRNVLIYFQEELQQKVLQRFMRSLHPDGFLVLGPQDGLAQLARAQGLEPVDRESQIFRLRKDGQHA
jgi:chemotaxis protein methyltransferase CheR